MQIRSSLQNFFQRAKQTIGEAVVGDDFVRRDGTVDGIVLGASAGAVVGGAIGASRGLYHQVSDQVVETPVLKNINDPSMNGYSYSVSEDWDRDCVRYGDHETCDWELDGWRHRYSPNISNRVVGTYSEPTLQHSHRLTTVSSAVTGAAIGAGVGAALGLATGIAGRALGGHPLKRKPLPDDMRQQLVKDSGETVFKSTAIGAGLGAAVGLGAGLLEQSKSAVVERTWTAPVMVDKNLGSIPRNHYEWNFGGWDWSRPGDFRNHSPRGNTSVIRQAPVLGPDDKPHFHSVTKELDSSRLGPISGMLGGAVVGAGVGFATGIATSVVSRMLLQNGLE